VIFGLVASILHKVLHGRAGREGLKSSELSIRSNEKIIESLTSFREISVKNRQSQYSWEIGQIRVKLAETMAEVNFMPYVSKYVIESGLILATLIVASIAFIFSDVVRAVTILAIFLAAGMRIAPAVLRAQQSILTIKNSLGTAGQTLDLLDEVPNLSYPSSDCKELDFRYEGFSPEIILQNVTLKYPNSEDFALIDCSLKIPSGSSVAIVGPTGAGKTSMIDVILGIIEPTSGRVLLSSRTVKESIIKWPGSIGYVPQDIVIINGTLKDNVILGYSSSKIADEDVMSALEIAQLSDLSRTLPLGIDSVVGEKGSQLSGGQRQRIGIARAFLRDAPILLLDEPTSALDPTTEKELLNVLSHLMTRPTTLLVTHRLHAAHRADRILVLEKGRLVEEGKGEDLLSRKGAYWKLWQAMGSV
jgi:ABC-type multidrug transport system fused ATPase/permease subunit